MRQFDRRLAYHFDFTFVLLTMTLVATGVATIYSATWSPRSEGVWSNPLAVRQMMYGSVGFVAMLAAVMFDYRRLERYAYFIYALTLGLVVLVPVLGTVGGGARRWIDLGIVSIQPSEMIKVGLVIACARYFQRAHPSGDFKLRQAIPALILLSVPSALILAQPDLGTVGVIAIVFFSMMFFAGLKVRSFAFLAAVGGAAVPLLWGHLKPYQQQRVWTFLSPEMDPLGAGYHVIQSKIAIGSGMFWGKGFLLGTQNKLHFLPEQHTDFIFSVFAEEWGYVGALVLLGLYAAFVMRGIYVASRAKDRFGAVLTFGIVSMVFWQAVINIGMTSGVLPVVGIPLPFVSYGGSSLTTMMMAVGLIINVNMRRFVF